MQLTKTKLKRMIKEETQAALEEGWFGLGDDEEEEALAARHAAQEKAADEETAQWVARHKEEDEESFARARADRIAARNAEIDAAQAERFRRRAEKQRKEAEESAGLGRASYWTPDSYYDKRKRSRPMGSDAPEVTFSKFTEGTQMKITKTRLKKMIKEETRAALKEKAGFFGRMFGTEQEGTEEAIKAIGDLISQYQRAYSEDEFDSFINQSQEALDKYRELQYRENTPDGDQREKIKRRISSLIKAQNAATDQWLQMSKDRGEREHMENERLRRKREREREEEELRAQEREETREPDRERQSDFDKWQSGEDESYNYMTRMEEAKMKITKTRLKKMIKEEFGKVLSEREGETPQDVAARLQNIPPMGRSEAVNDFYNMKDGDTSLASYYPHVTDLQAFATEVLTLMGELDAPPGDVSDPMGDYDQDIESAGYPELSGQHSIRDYGE